MCQCQRRTFVVLEFALFVHFLKSEPNFQLAMVVCAFADFAETVLQTLIFTV